MPIRPSKRTILKIIQIHAQHGQSAFSPKARIRLNELAGGPSVAVV
jgi:hypothetical protein